MPRHFDVNYVALHMGTHTKATVLLLHVSASLQ